MALPGETPAEPESDLERAGVPGRECALEGGGGALEERHRLAAAASVAERAAELAREDRDVRVVFAERGTLEIERLAVEALRFAVLVPGQEQVRVVDERGRDGGGAGREDASLERDRRAEQRIRLVDPIELVESGGEVAHTERGVRVLRPDGRFQNAERLAVQRLGFVGAAHALQDLREVVGLAGHARVVRAEEGAVDVEDLAAE